MRRILSLCMALALVIGMLCIRTSAAQGTVKLALKLDGELNAGETVKAELLCEENPGLGAIQFTLAYDHTVLKCTACSAGPVLQAMLNAMNPEHKNGAIVVGASANAVNDTGVLAWFTFEVLEVGESAFELVDVVLGTETGEALSYEFCVVESEQPETPAEPEQPETPAEPEQPETPAEPEQPETPAEPEQPETPAEPEQPETPAEPEQPETPAEPEQPEPPAEPEQPETPAESETVQPSTPSGGGGVSGNQTTKPDEKVEEEDELLAFTDIAGHWAEDYLTIAKERDLVAGYPDGRCGPDDQVTRAQFVTILWKEAGRPTPTVQSSFVDLEPGEYYLDAVAWAAEQGYVAGKGDNRFAPNDPVSREEMAVILRKLGNASAGMEQMFAGMYDEHFTDSAETSSWGKAAVYWAVYQEVWCGKSSVNMGNELKATAPASRAEVAVMIINYQDKVER